MEHIFICYSRKDKNTAFILKDELEKAGKDIWIDIEDLPASSVWRVEIRDAITKSIAFIYLVSANSLASEYCQQEFEFAQILNKRIFPILLKINEKKVSKEITDKQFLRWIDIEEDSNAIKKLIKNIEVDHVWVNFHTQLHKKLYEWENNGKDKSDLLHGKELTRTEKSFISNFRKKPPLTVRWIRLFRVENGSQEGGLIC